MGAGLDAEAMACEGERRYRALRFAELDTARPDIVVWVPPEEGGGGPMEVYTDDSRSGSGSASGSGSDVGGSDASDDVDARDGPSAATAADPTSARRRPRPSNHPQPPRPPRVEVRLAYRLLPGGPGVLFSRCGRFAATNTAVHGARGWLPGADLAGWTTCHSFTVDVPADLVAIAPGVPPRATMGGDGTDGNPVVTKWLPAGQAPRPGRHSTYLFRGALSCPAGHLAVAVGPFGSHEVDLPPLPAALGRPAGFASWPRARGPGALRPRLLAEGRRATDAAAAGAALASAIAAIETHLSCPLPAASLSIVFLPDECLGASHSGAGPAPDPPCLQGLALLPASLARPALRAPDAFLEVVASLCLIAAHQWFGVFLHASPPRNKRRRGGRPSDTAGHGASLWGAAGVARHLAFIALGGLAGKNEAEWRLREGRRAALEADAAGCLPPLSSPFRPFADLRAVADGADGVVSAPGVGTAGGGSREDLEACVRDRGTDLRATETLGAGPVEAKAHALIAALARRAGGNDELRRCLQSLCLQAAGPGPPPVLQATSLAPTLAYVSEKGRLLDGRALLRRALGRSGDGRLDRAIAARWVHGRGATSVSVAVAYDPPLAGRGAGGGGHTFRVAARQTGDMAAQTSAQAAAQAGGGWGALRVALHETDGPNAATLALGDLSSAVETVECRSRRQASRKPKKRKADAAAAAADDTDLPPRAGNPDASPLEWIEVDEDLQWPALVRLEGGGSLPDTLRCLETALLHSKSASAQADAVRELSRLGHEVPGCEVPAGHMVIAAACAKGAFCRVRALAARAVPELDALARSRAAAMPPGPARVRAVADAESLRSAPSLAGVVHEACADGTLRSAHRDLGLLALAADAALALAELRGSGPDGRFSPDEAAETLLDILDKSERWTTTAGAAGSAGLLPPQPAALEGGPDDTSLRAAFLLALGRLRPRPPASSAGANAAATHGNAAEHDDDDNDVGLVDASRSGAGGLVKKAAAQLGRHLQLDAVAPSEGRELTRAALGGLTGLALGSLEMAAGGGGGSPVADPAVLARLLREHTRWPWPGGVRIAAGCCLADLIASGALTTSGGFESGGGGPLAAALSHLLDSVDAENGGGDEDEARPGVQLALLDHAQATLLAAVGWAGGDDPPPPGQSGRGSAFASVPLPPSATSSLSARLLTLTGMGTVTGSGTGTGRAPLLHPGPRHRAWCLLQTLGGRSPCLYRPTPEAEQRALGWRPVLSAGGQEAAWVGRGAARGRSRAAAAAVAASAAENDVAVVNAPAVAAPVPAPAAPTPVHAAPTSTGLKIKIGGLRVKLGTAAAAPKPPPEEPEAPHPPPA